ncbi:helix-turn-helix domain-containing protein [Streptomyces sp. NPDC048511]|uniref:helix-turn-helix domain-containing protein n=1 Tax=Streptomyces sp. NPDC048511 TaxID=3365562 RepID=UPI0037182FF3
MITASRPGTDRHRLYASTTDTYDTDLDIDYVAVERVMNGDLVALTLTEKAMAARLLDARGASIRSIATLLDVDKATVTRWKATGWQVKRPARCGEPRMYRRHVYRGETPCRRCRDAFTAERRNERAAKKQTTTPGRDA